MRFWQTAIMLGMFCGLLLVAPGCASERHAPGRGASQDSIERPARGLDEEQSFGDKLGEFGVVLLVVGSVAAGIILPLLLL